jgi:hypothetical protein
LCLNFYGIIDSNSFSRARVLNESHFALALRFARSLPFRYRVDVLHGRARSEDVAVRSWSRTVKLLAGKSFSVCFVGLISSLFSGPIEVVTEEHSGRRGAKASYGADSWHEGSNRMEVSFSYFLNFLL